MTALGASESPIVRLRHDLELRVIDGEGAFLVSERGVTVLEGRIAIAVASRLDGTRTPEEIVFELNEHYPGDRVRDALNRLVSSRVAVIEYGHNHQQFAGEASFYEMGGIEWSTASQRLASSVVAVHTIGEVDGADLIDHLRASGVGRVVGPVRPAEHVAGATLSVVVTDDYLRHEIDLVNRTALTTGTPWMLAQPVGSVVWVGPLFRPSVNACWSCLTHRIMTNRESHSYLQGRLGESPPIGKSKVRHRAASSIGAGLVAVEVLKTITGIATAEPCIATTDLLSGETKLHHVIRRPQCPVCGDGTLMAARALDPVKFSPRKKASTSDGGHRAVKPTEMVERFSNQVSPITGVVTSLERVPVTEEPVWVFTAGQNVSRRPRDLQALRRGLRASSCGKGMTESQARASAIGEAIERWSGAFQGDEPRRRATLSEMGDAAIHPNECTLFSKRQYEHRQLWNLGESGFRTVFEPFVENESIDWSPVWSITGQRTRWLPTQYLYYGYPLGDGRLFAYADSNGCASGTSLEDAALQGFCELVERDSVAIWWYNRIRRPGINLDSFNDPYIDRLRDIYAGLGREVWALDLTADLNVPAVGAFSRVTEGEREDILIAFGAHLEPRVAVLRALTEMNQFLPAVLPTVNGAPAALSADAAFTSWRQTATVANQPYLSPDPLVAPRTATSWPSLATNDLLTDLTYCQRVVEEHDLELLLLDQTRPDVGLPVVKVIVPGLRHFWPRFAPGRLFDVPVALGWCPRKTEEHLLNPVPIFI